jgi:hypothetical protein
MQRMYGAEQAPCFLKCDTTNWRSRCDGLHKLMSRMNVNRRAVSGISDHKVTGKPATLSSDYDDAMQHFWSRADVINAAVNDPA